MIRADNGRGEFKERVKKDIIDIAKGKYLRICFPAKYGEPEQDFSVKVGEFIKFSYRTRNPILMHERHAEALKIVDAFKTGLKRENTPLQHEQISIFSEQIFAFYCKHCDRKDSVISNLEILVSYYKYFEDANDRTETSYKRYRGVLPFAESDTFQEWLDKFYELDIQLMENFHANKRIPEENSVVEALECQAGAVTTWWLALKGIKLHPKDRTKLLYGVAQAASDNPYVGFARKEDLSRKFDYDAIIKEGSRPKGPELISEAFSRWEQEEEPAYNTLRQWRPKIRAFADYLGHEVMKKVTEQDVQDWADTLLRRGIEVRTIASCHLAALKAIFSFARKKRWITTDPAKGIKMSKAIPRKDRQKPYADDEVFRILELSKEHYDKEQDEAIRWMSPLLAYTGARPGELAQLWADHIRIEDGINVIDIKPSADGGTIKNDASIRAVPIHSALVEMGFLNFVASRVGKPLFYDVKKRLHSPKHPSDYVVHRNGQWIRTLGIDMKNKRPNHAFRHWFKTKLSKLNVQDSVADMIQGHSPPKEANRYRHIDVRTMTGAVELIQIAPVKAS